MGKEVFVGRIHELEDLKSLWKKKSAKFVVVKGRRRIGKSRLLEEFSIGKKTYRFAGIPPHSRTTKENQLDEFSRQLSETTGLPEIKADDWSKLFALLGREAQKGHVLIILDEISWIGSQDPNFLGKLKHAWDTIFKKNPNLMLIICGSVSTWIDENILNSKGFYGRVSWTIQLGPLPLYDCDKMLKSQGFRSSVYEKFKILSVTGGVPWYIEQFHGEYSAEENIKRQCFMKEGALVDEFEKVFHDVFGKRDQTYKEIVEVIADGPSDYQTISKKSGYKSSGRLSQYLLDLENGGFISKSHSWSFETGKEKKLIFQYRLSDNYLRFFLKYIQPHLNQIRKGRYKNISLSSLPNWESIMGLQFENLVLNNREEILTLLNIRPEEILNDNPYNQPATTRKKGCQIDYLIQTKNKTLFLCEVKFSKNKLNSKVVEEISKKIEKLSVPKGIAILPVLIHVNGVSSHVEKDPRLQKIIDFSDLLDRNLSS